MFANGKTKNMKKGAAILLVLLIITQIFSVAINLKVRADETKVIVLDPGHGAQTIGAVNAAEGLYEYEITYKIAQYCKQELERYNDVEVYITRSSLEDTPELDERAEFAYQHGADALVSIHINSASTVSANGVEAFVSAYDEYSTSGLASIILGRLSSDIGFYNRGVKTKLSESGLYYDNGSLADYYAIIRNSARLGVKAMLLEHGFIGNSTDASYMNSDEKLKKIGIADASGIAEYYGLTLSDGSSDGNISDKAILSPQSATVQQCEEWARGRGATETFVSLASIYFKVATERGVNPVMAYAQAAVETGYGKFGGAVPESYHNPCGLKKNGASGDTSDCFEEFPDWETGITAQCDHLALYAGASGYPKSDTPDPRHYSYLLGKVSTVMGLAGTWAADTKYSNTILSLMNDIEGIVVIEPTVALNATAITINQEASATLIASSSPEGTVTWSSDNSSIVRVDENGRVTGIGAGSAVITATSTNGASAQCTVTVLPFAAYIEISSTELGLLIGESYELSAQVYPENTFESKIIWSSDDENVAAVTSSGKVTGINYGRAKITAYVNEEIQAVCEVTVIKPVESITLDLHEKTIYAGSSFELKALIEPDDATDKTVIWSSDNEDIAVVDNYGFVTAVAEGEATITATSSNDLTDECKVQVFTPVESVILDRETLEMYKGTEIKLNASISPQNVYDNTITWVSDNTSVATVSMDGTVTARGNGTTTIRAKAHNGVAASCIVTVGEDVESIIINDKRDLVYDGESFALSATIYPESSLDKSVSWSSSDSTVAEVDELGNIKALKAGTATITALAGNGKSDSYILNVRQSVTGIEINCKSRIMGRDEKYKLNVTVSPSNAYTKTVSWVSSDPSVASVAEDGTVTAHANGDAVIVAIAHNGKTAECRITVYPSVENVTIKDKVETAYTGNGFTLTAVIAPENSVNKNITWTSDNESVATVDSNGTVNCIKAGTAVITAKADNGALDSYVLTVLQKTESIKLDRKTLSLSLGASYKLAATVLPEDASDKSLIWTSSNPDVAAVASDGNITPRGTGVSIITAETVDGIRATCSVTVSVNVVTVSIEDENGNSIENIEAYPGENIDLKAFASDGISKILWKSSSSDVAEISGEGRIYCNSPGETVITAYTSNGASAEVTVYVRQPVESVVIKQIDVQIIRGATYKLRTSVTPSNAYNTRLTWTSSDTDIATVDSEGRVNARAKGTAVITATAHNGKSASVNVTVIDTFSPSPVEAESISIINGVSYAYSGDTFVLEYQILPENTTNKYVVWTSSNPSVASVNSLGKVDCLSAGSTVITAETSNGKTSKIEITVIRKVSGDLEVENNGEANIGFGDTYHIVSNGNASENEIDLNDSENLEWTTSDENVVEIDENGNITGKFPGIATITATNDLGETFKILVSVNKIASVSVPQFLVNSRLKTTDENVSASVKTESKVLKHIEKDAVFGSIDRTVCEILVRI